MLLFGLNNIINRKCLVKKSVIKNINFQNSLSNHTLTIQQVTQRYDNYFTLTALLRYVNRSSGG